MLTHVMIEVADIERSKAFYEATLSTLAIRPMMLVRNDDDAPLTNVGFGEDGPPFFWLSSVGRTPGYTHVAFAAASIEEVKAFHAAALAAGGRDNGGPGPRPKYDPDYYAAYVFDPDGNNIEAACRTKPV